MLRANRQLRAGQQLMFTGLSPHYKPITKIYSAKVCYSSFSPTYVPVATASVLRHSPVAHNLVSNRWLQSDASQGVSLYDTHLEIHNAGKNIQLNYVWMRDHCRCAKCYNDVTRQRLFDITTIDMNIQPKNMKIKKNGDNRELHIVWPDKHETVYSMEWLEKNSYSGVSQSEWSKKRILWDAGSIQDSMPTVVDYKSYMQHDESLKQVLENLVVYGFAVVGDDVPLSVEETQKVAERISYVRVTLYGKMWSFSSNLQMLDTAYTSEGLRAHVDNTYFNDPAGLQVFHVLTHDGDGGKTVLVDGFKAAENLKTKNPEYYDILSRVGLKHQFIDRDIHVAATGPILYHDPVSNELSQVRFNTYDRTTISHLDNHNLMAFYHALSSYAKEVASSENELWFKLRPGNVLLVDNWRVMHGRSSFTGYRHICGCYMPRDDLIGRFRTLLGMKI